MRNKGKAATALWLASAMAVVLWSCVPRCAEAREWPRVLIPTEISPTGQMLVQGDSAWAPPDHVHSISLQQDPLPVVHGESAAWAVPLILEILGLFLGVCSGMWVGFRAGETVHANARLWICQVCGQIGATTRDLEFEEIEHMLATGCTGRVLPSGRGGEFCSQRRDERNDHDGTT